MSVLTNVIESLGRATLLLMICVGGNVVTAAECDVACDDLTDAWTCDGCGTSPAEPDCFYDRMTGSLAESGILFQSNITQFYTGTVDGGFEQTDLYGGHGDYLGIFDFGKLGVQEGLFLQVRAEHRFGRSITEPSGVFLPPTITADLPVVDSRDLYLTNFLITQALSESFVVFGGKLDTLDGDKNAFAHGRGVRQFSNAALVANPVALRTIPYSTIGFGFATLLDGEPLFSFTLLNAVDTTDSFGVDELFAEGAAISTELRVPTNFLRKPGHVLLGGTWSSRNFAALDQDPRIVFPTVAIDRKSDSWSLYFNTDQYLVTDPRDASRGWGFFTRGGISDEDTNPIAYFLSAGIGGNSPIRGRENDTFGVGYYYAGLSDELAPFIATVAGNLGDGSGTELFYNVQATKHVTVTPDLQFLNPGRDTVDDVVILGVRVNISI
ncbi:Carbohydrate-selective porin, OprB family [Rubripirellula tenax]|uniref:Carbohydrate-selective porin, OprB family n=1 Tax=Rubripirellula tenax TaxID=2528015 RepID=A0A5C6FFY6_9BACT|nr:carbohydrate porin [Rubripirellula tenax]TWU58559.1 Carbohydrate-selective porin, OprB family [Rubripirellula tenax]